MEITRGKQTGKPVRAVMYGPEGIGKSTFASQWPEPLFIDVERGTGQLDIARTPSPTSWTMLKAIIEELTKNAQGFKTLVIDTADWVDKLAIAEICAKSNKNSIEDFRYGKGWTALSEEWKRILDQLADFQSKTGMHILFLAHATMRKFEQPDEAGAYDRYELKMEKKSSSLLKEWADLLLFANYKTIVTEIDGKKKAQGGTRVMYTAHHSCWDAKNRFGLKTELPFEFKSIATVIQTVTVEAKVSTPPVVKETVSPVAPQNQPQSKTDACPPPAATKVSDPVNRTSSLPECLPVKLRDLMCLSGVTVDELKAICTKTYPPQTPIENYDPKFFEGNIIPNWEKALSLIEKIRINK